MLMMTASSVPLSVMMTSSPVAATVRTTEPTLLRRSVKLWVLMCTHVSQIGASARAPPDSPIANDLPALACSSHARRSGDWHRAAARNFAPLDARVPPHLRHATAAHCPNHSAARGVSQLRLEFEPLDP